MQKRTLGFILIIISGIGYSIGAILIRALNTTTGLTPINIAVLRFLIASPLVWLFLPRNSMQAMPKKDRTRFMLLGIVFSVASISAMFALDRLPSSLYVILLYSYPGLVVIYALINHQPIPALTWVGLPLSILGLLLTVFQFDKRLEVDLVGLLFTLLNSLAVAAYFILSGLFFGRQQTRTPGTAWMFAGAMLISILAIPLTHLNLPQSTSEWLLMLGLSTFGTVMPILATNAGIQLIGAPRASMLNIVQPLVTVLLSILIFQESLNPLQWVGASIVLFSIFLLQTSSDKSRSVAHEI